MKKNLHIEIVSSAISELSSMSHESRLSIKEKLESKYKKVGISIVNNESDLANLLEKSPDIVFLGMKYLPTDSGISKIWLSDYLSREGIVCTGSNSSAHKLELNKHSAKQMIRRAGLKTSDSILIKANEILDFSRIKLSFPLFIKPSNLGGGACIDSESVAWSFEQLKSKVNSIIQSRSTNVLVEQFLPGREFSVAVLKDNESGELLTFPIELIAPQDTNGIRMLSSQVKSSNSEKVEALPRGDKIYEEVCELASGAFTALGARDYGRIDIRLNENEEPHFLEANLIPSLIDGYGSFPKACDLHLGLNHAEMLETIISLSLNRSHNMIIQSSDDIGMPAIVDTLSAVV